MLKKMKDRFQLWITAKLFPLAVIAGARRSHMSHNSGVAGRGQLRIVDNPEFPEHAFFTPGREFPCRVRHAAVGWYDDAMLIVRSMTVKFADTLYRSPFDLEMNTGRITFFWNANSFLKFVMNREADRGNDYKKYYAEYHRGLLGARSGLRRLPDSVESLYYYSQTPYLWLAKDGTRYYAKFRGIPHDRRPETGIPDARDISTPDALHNQRVLKDGEPPSMTYSKDEFRERCENGDGLRYLLQMQLYQLEPGMSAEDDAQIANSNYEWDETKHPFLDLAQIHVTEAFDYPTSNNHYFWVGHVPPGVQIPEAKSVMDPHSLLYMRKRVWPAFYMRWLLTKIFGMPPEIRDEFRELRKDLKDSAFDLMPDQKGSEGKVKYS